MNKIRQILRGHFEGHGSKQLSKLTGVSLNTIKVLPKKIQDYLGRQSLTMHFEHQPGEKVFIGYAGKKLYVIDPHTGEQFAVEVFVATLGCSQYTYVEATFTQKKPDFIGSCRRVLELFRGVPRVIVPDNLKSAVIKGASILLS
ncbi:hypothetical protein [Algoriphagus aquimarinus]|uniref:hypothetical protein n=1 Tax=Algoriphagus aquimarinus TaxID=237018 RepID=UPI0030DB456B